MSRQNGNRTQEGLYEGLRTTGPEGDSMSHRMGLRREQRSMETRGRIEGVWEGWKGATSEGTGRRSKGLGRSQRSHDMILRWYRKRGHQCGCEKGATRRGPSAETYV